MVTGDDSPSAGGAAAEEPWPVGASPVDRAASAARLEALAPGYLERVRRAASRLGHRDSAVIDLVSAFADVEDTSQLDLEAPTLSRARTGRMVKVGVKRLISWYLRYLTQQLAAFTAAVTRFGAVVVERTDQLEEASAGMGRELEQLRRRIERLEAPGGPGGTGDGGPPA